MEHLDKIDKMIQQHKSITQKIKILKGNIGHIEEDGSDFEVDVYTMSWYGEYPSICDVEGCFNNLRSLQDKVVNPEEGFDLGELFFYYSDTVLIPYRRLTGVDVDSLSVRITTEEEPEPYEDYTNTVCTLTLCGEFPWSEEQQKEERDKAEVKLKELNEKLIELETQMKGMSLM